MTREDVDFVVQLGDFCRPYDYNRSFMAMWDTFPGPRYHVHGNHDVDGGFTREQVMEYWGMPARYYSFTCRGWTGVVLDGNEIKEGGEAGYPRFVGDEQLDWLRHQLMSRETTVLLFLHQSPVDLGRESLALENGRQVREVLESANRAAGRRKVVACFSGHHHTDGHTRIEGIDYLQINSMSNFWLGNGYECVRYGAQIDRDHPWIKYTAPYRDPLSAIVSIDSEGSISIDGTASEYVGPSPWDLGYPRRDNADSIIPEIRNREIAAP
jgi:hypothetical protein